MYVCNRRLTLKTTIIEVYYIYIIYIISTIFEVYFIIYIYTIYMYVVSFKNKSVVEEKSCKS